jgi:hypothetical protein
MNTKIIPRLMAFFLLTIIFYSCEDSTYKQYKAYSPVYLSYNVLRTSVAPEQNVDLKKPGKMYFKDNYIFIVEELKGIHVFDNTDPSAPVKKVFIKVPGAVDMAIAGNIMYIDSYVDLVILDLQDIDNIKEVGRMKEIIPYTVPSFGNDYPMGRIDQDKGVVISWELKTIRERIDYNPTPYPFYKDGLYFSNQLAATGSSSGVSGSGVGIGGSMARFGIKDNVLYLLGNNSLKIIDITVKTSPVNMNEIHPGATVETMFLTGKNMFLGTTTGMVIYDISVPTLPKSRIFFNHARSCDPVIVDDTLAYVTLRSGTNCGGVLNCLDVVNIKDLSKPSQVISYGMTNPHGLGKSGKVLFVCDGSAGLKIYDASNPKQILNNVLKTYPGINAYDVIPLGTVLVMVGDDGLYQYNYSDILNITLLSKIQVVAK